MPHKITFATLAWPSHHCGIFANGHRAEKLALCRELIEVAPTVNEEQGHDVDHTDDHRLAHVVAFAWRSSRPSSMVSGASTESTPRKFRSTSLAVIPEVRAAKYAGASLIQGLAA
jgi:hypothetical protein